MFAGKIDFMLLDNDGTELALYLTENKGVIICQISIHLINLLDYVLLNVVVGNIVGGS